MDETRIYKVTRIQASTHDAEYFEDYEEAEARAIECSLDDEFWGVWDDKTDRLEAIAYSGECYRQ